MTARVAPLLALTLLALLLPGMAMAQEALYGAQPPPGAAFVRFVNATDGEVAVRPDFLPPQRLGASGAERVGAYAAVGRVAGRALEVSVQAGARTAHATLSAAPGGYVTVLLLPAPGGVAAVPVADAADFNQARARLVFYNAVPGCPSASLGLAPSGPAVFEGVPPGAAKSRGVSPVQASLRAACAGSAAPDLALAGMEAGGSYSVWLMQPGGALAAFATRDKTLPYKP